MNIQYLFNVLYYDGLYGNNNADHVKQINDRLIRMTLNTEDIPQIMSAKDIHCIKLQTVYPGLLVGTGNPHSAGDNPEEIKLGFTFDYTTGLPYISGSTVKGVLRSVIKENDKKKEKETEESFKVRKEAYENRLKYLRELIAEITGLQESDKKLSDENLREFEFETFGNDKNGKGDLFLDAYPIRGGHGNRLFAFESITPHNTFKDPIPLTLLKVIPEVVFEFKFIIKNSEKIPELTADKKERLYKRILMDFGVGAKTNVGFGVLEEFDGNIEVFNDTVEEDTILANVIGYNDKKTTAKLLCDTEQKASLYFKDVPGTEYGRIDEKLPINTRVRIRNEGKDDNGYEKWSLVEIIE